MTRAEWTERALAPAARDALARDLAKALPYPDEAQRVFLDLVDEAITEHAALRVPAQQDALDRKARVSRLAKAARGFAEAVANFDEESGERVEQAIWAAEGKGPEIPYFEVAREAGVLAARVPETLGGLCDLYIERHLKSKVRRWENNAKPEIENHIRPRLGNLALEALTRAHVREMIREVAEDYPVAANRSLGRLKAILNWAVAEDLVKANVAAGIKRPTREKPVDRILSDAELRAIWKATEALEYPAREFASLLILSGQRRDDVRLMRWEEIDLEGRIWVIPADRYKSRRPQLVPLPDAMIDIIERLHYKKNGRFALSLNGGEKPYSNVTKPKSTVDKAAKVTGWTWHDLRRTMRTGLSRLGIREDIAERTIGHAVGGRLGLTYNLYDYADEKRLALEAWAAHVQGLQSEKVVQLHG